MRYVFYDTETTGLSPAYDQVVQFAAIVTDHNFKKLEELNIRCRRRKHIVPSPTAMLITRVTPKVLEEQELSHFEMAAQIASWIKRQTPSIWIGHNSIYFDEEFLRQTFYQNLLNPYLTNRNGNFRSDTMILAHALAHLDPNAIEIPQQNGRHKFKLGMLAEANALQTNTQNLHDAYNDVDATILLAGLIKRKNKSVWNAMLQNADPEHVKKLVQEPRAISVSGFVMGRPYSYSALGLFENPHNKNEYAMANLGVDLADTEEKKSRAVSLIASKRARLIRANRLPIVFADMPSKIVETSFPTKRKVAEYMRYFQRPECRANIIDYFNEKKTGRRVSDNVEENIYQAFPSSDDEKRMLSFAIGSWKERVELAGKFNDRRFNELSNRLICEHAKSLVPRLLLKRYESWKRDVFDGKDFSERRSISGAISELEQLVDDYPNRLSEIKDIHRYIRKLAD